MEGGTGMSGIVKELSSLPRTSRNQMTHANGGEDSSTAKGRFTETWAVFMGPAKERRGS